MIDFFLLVGSWVGIKPRPPRRSLGTVPPGNPCAIDCFNGLVALNHSPLIEGSFVVV